MEISPIIIKNVDCQVVVYNISKYSLQIINNNLYLTPLEIYLKDYEVYRYELKKSEILEAKLNDTIIKNPSYYKILKMIWKLTPVNIILQHTIFNFKLDVDSIKGDDSYIWNEEINLAFQTRSYNNAFKEIVNMCKVNKYDIILKIKLSNDNIILFKHMK
jgi:hypothetical protein